MVHSSRGVVWLVVAVCVVFLSACAVAPPDRPRVVMKQAFDGGVWQLERSAGVCQLRLTGEVGEDAIRKLRAVLDDAERARCVPQAVRLEGVDGPINSAISLGSMFRNRQMNTVIESTAPCRTTCLLLFVAGRDRSVPNEPRQLGFNALTGEGVGGALSCQAPPSRNQMITLGRYVHAMLERPASGQVLEWIASASCERMLAVSADALRQAGVATR